MKNKKLLVLAAMSTLVLVGCGNKKSDPKPAENNVVDVSTDEGKALLASKLTATLKAYEGLDFSCASVKATANLNASAKADATFEGDVGSISLNAEIKNFGAQAEAKVVKVAKDAQVEESYDSLAASLVAKTTGGSLSLKGSLPGQEEGTTAAINSSLSLGGAEAGVYLKEDKLYVNLANDGNEALAEGADTFANGLLGQLGESMFGPLVPYLLSSIEDLKGIYDPELNKFLIADAYKEHAADANTYLNLGKPVEFPAIDIDEQGEDFTSFIDSVVELAKQNIGFKFINNKDNSYSFELAMDKAALKNLVSATGEEGIEETVAQIEKYVSKFSLNVSVNFGKDLLLASENLSFSIEGSLDKDILGDYSGTFSAFKTDFSASGSENVEVKYSGVSIEYPSFEGYKEFVLFGNKDNSDE